MTRLQLEAAVAAIDTASTTSLIVLQTRNIFFSRAALRAACDTRALLLRFRRVVEVEESRQHLAASTWWYALLLALIDTFKVIPVTGIIAASKAVTSSGLHWPNSIGPTMCPSFTVILVAGAIYLAAWTFYVVHLTHSSHLRGIGSPAAPAADVFPSFDVHGDRRSYTRLGASLPPVPDVAVYFNCWSKDLQHYLAFPSIVRRINASTARYIYITSGASATQDATAPAPCDLVSNALFEHLSAAFPCTTVVYRRRTRADTVRALLQLAPTAICASAPSQQPSQPPQHNNICSQLPPISPDNDIIVTTAAPLPQVPPQPSFSWFPPRTPKPPPSPADTLLAELRSDSRAALGSRGTTVVTAFYRISSKYSLRTYDGWIANFMRMGFRCLVYGDDDAVAYMRARWPATADRVYVVRPLSAFTTARWDWSADEDLDPVRRAGPVARDGPWSCRCSSWTWPRPSCPAAAPAPLALPLWPCSFPYPCPCPCATACLSRLHPQRTHRHSSSLAHIPSHMHLSGAMRGSRQNTLPNLERKTVPRRRRRAPRPLPHRDLCLGGRRLLPRGRQAAAVPRLPRRHQGRPVILSRPYLAPYLALLQCT